MKVLFSVLIALVLSLAAFGQSEHKKYKNSDEVPRLTLADAKKAYDDGSAIFIDARSAESYKDVHVKGATNMPYGSTTDFSSLPKGKRIIVYCS